MNILAIESSCDETSVAIIRDSEVLCNIISSQHFHSQYGGVIPELASRAHLHSISMITREALAQAELNICDTDAVAVTSEPGLIGSLIVGSNFAKGLSVKYGIPIIPVNHIEGHIYSGSLQERDLTFPYISLVVSGGHTALFYVNSFTEYILIGSTLDDAAGEAFDKIAALLGLPYPGGPHIDQLARSGKPDQFNFPRSMIHSNDLNFSFSGLKTSVRYFLKNEYENNIPSELVPHLCASAQEAIVDVLVRKSFRAAHEYDVQAIVIAGGVSANSRLREKMQKLSSSHNLFIITPDMSYCMDNAAMIGFVAEKKLHEGGKNQYKRLNFTVNANALRAKAKSNNHQELKK